MGKKEGAVPFFSLHPKLRWQVQPIRADTCQPDGVPDVYLIGDGNMGSFNGNMGSRDGNKGSQDGAETGIWVPDRTVSRDAPCHFP